MVSSSYKNLGDGERIKQDSLKVINLEKKEASPDRKSSRSRLEGVKGLYPFWAVL